MHVGWRENLDGEGRERERGRPRRDREDEMVDAGRGR